MKTPIKTKYLLLWDRMGDYHRARIRELVSIAGTEQVWAGDLGGEDTLYGWKSSNESGNYFRLSEKQVEKVGAFEGLKAFRKLVKKEQITHVCIPGYGRGAYLLMIIWARLSGRKVLMFAESWYAGSFLSDYLKGLFLRVFTHTCFLSGEKAQKHFITRLHYPPKKIFTGYSVIDNTHFAQHKNEKSSPPQLLCLARFSEEKDLTLLIQSFKKSVLSKNWELVLVGGGPQKDELQVISEGSAVRLIDWIDYPELPELYGKASCFVLPSRFEPWGLVVNEAMAAGLPLILSDQVGALPDLLKVNVNGWSFISGNEKDLIRVLNELSIIDRNVLPEMGKRSEAIVSQFSCLKWAEVISGKW
jgi:glycosyltransferase involved in cell wall biosynthesis